MEFIKKHPFLIVYFVLLVAAVVLKIGFGYILLGTLVFLVVASLIRLPNTAAYLGYLFQGFWGKPETAFKLYSFAYSHGSTAKAPKVAYAMQLMQKTRYEESKNALEDLLADESLKPTLLKIVRQDVAIAYWNTGDVQRAIDTMEKMKEDYDLLSAEFFTTLGYFYVEAGDYEKAAETTETALSMDEGNGGAYDNLGVIAYKQGNLEEALELFTKALELKETMASSKYYLGLIYEQLGDEDQAKSYFTAAHNSNITGLNTVTREQVDEKYREYMDR